jgi:phytoene dehydrogenase-like protein
VPALRGGGRAGRDVVDAVVVGSGPNGLAAAVTLARAGRSVHVLEAAGTIGGGARSAELTLPGFVHDTCSAIHPLGVASPVFRMLPLAEHGLSFCHPPAPLAHPFDDGSAVVLERSVAETARSLDRCDVAAYCRLMWPAARVLRDLIADVRGPLRMLRHPVALARLGLLSAGSAVGLATSTFAGERARGLIAGLGAHAFLPLEQSPSAGFALALGLLGHVVGWPVIRGGSQRLPDALAGYLRSLGGTITTGRRVETLSDLPSARTVLLELAPRGLLEIAGSRLPTGYRRQLERYRHGPAAFKMDWALDGPVPWAAEGCRRAGTVHLGGTLEEVAAAERATARGEDPERPFVLLAQQSLFDPTRAPEGRHAVYAYAHVSNGSTLDMTERIEAQIERFAPGFRDRILARSVRSPSALEHDNPNYVGGDILGGLNNFGQLIARPAPRLVPYSTPFKGVYLCSASTPPGGGIHGLCGYLAAQAALRGLR